MLYPDESLPCAVNGEVCNFCLNCLLAQQREITGHQTVMGLDQARPRS